MSREEIIKKKAEEFKDKEEEITKYFDFLDSLRDSGQTNMYGAAPYLVEEYSLDKQKARNILVAWMDSFEK